MNKGELDVSYITSRLIVMSYPAEGVESAIKNHIDDVREFLETHHPGSYAVYNLSNRSYRTVKFQNRVCVVFYLQNRCENVNCNFVFSVQRRSPTQALAGPGVEQLR